MKNFVTIAFCTLIFWSNAAKADYRLASNGKKVICYGEDNLSISLDAKRTSIKLVVEGESLGAQRITEKKSDGRTYVSYTFEQGVLSLSNQGDTFRYTDSDEVGDLNCK